MEALKGDSLFADGISDDFRQCLLNYHILSFYETRPYDNFGLVGPQLCLTNALPLTALGGGQGLCHTWSTRLARETNSIRR